MHYLCRRLGSGEGIVTLAVTLCVCPPSRLYHTSTARRLSLGSEGNSLYPVLSSYLRCDSVTALLKNVKAEYSSSWESISELRGVTCHLGSLSVTCHLTQVNAPTITPANQAGTQFTYP